MEKRLIAYKDDICEFGKDESGAVYFIFNTKRYDLSSSPYEPCTYIKSDGMQIILHNAFDVYDLPEYFLSNGTIHSITGRSYGVKVFCALIRAVIKSGRQELDITEAESMISFSDALGYPYNIIHKIIRSPELSDLLTERGMKFSPEGIVAFIYEYAKSYDDILDLLDACIGTEAEECAQMLKKNLEAKRMEIMTAEAGTVFELRIRDAGNSQNFESYLCASFEAALERFDRFLREYESVIEKPQYFSVLKRRIAKMGDEFSEDEIGQIDFFPDKSIKSVLLPYKDYGLLPEYVDFTAVHPFKKKDIIKTTDEETEFYVCAGDDGEKETDALFCIPLNMPEMRDGQFCNALLSHRHIRLPLAERAKYAELPADLQIVYVRFCEFLDKLDKKELIECRYEVSARNGYTAFMKKALDVLCEKLDISVPQVNKAKKGEKYFAGAGFTVPTEKADNDFFISLLHDIGKGPKHRFSYADGRTEFRFGERCDNFSVMIEVWKME